MSKPNVLILKAAGVNCDAETAFAFEAAGGAAEHVHVNRLASGERRLGDYQILALCGGFSYGDDIAAGKVLANELKNKLFEDIKTFVERGNLVIGICNGFQVLVKAGILPGNERFEQEATLYANDSGVFQDRWVYLKIQNSKSKIQNCVWTKNLPEVIYLPIAHGEGKFIPKNEEVLERMRNSGQIVFRYCDRRGALDTEGANPNGSLDNIAGICDSTGRVLGLMPHPERHVLGLQHPRWTREGLKAYGDGFAVFRNAVAYFK